MCQRLGCDAVADGKSANVVEDAKRFCPDGYHGAVVFAGNDDGWDDGPRFHVNIAKVYQLDECSVALRDVENHFVGKLTLQVR